MAPRKPANSVRHRSIADLYRHEIEKLNEITRIADRLERGRALGANKQRLQAEAIHGRWEFLAMILLMETPTLTIAQLARRIQALPDGVRPNGKPYSERVIADALKGKKRRLAVDARYWVEKYGRTSD